MSDLRTAQSLTNEGVDEPSFKYDVAFSFLQQDEDLATKLNDLIQDRLKTFLYSKRQGEIAGTDGETSFGRVFAQDARTVVVLYRRGWGETPWTRIEQTGIRNRAYEKGYDFCLFIPLDRPPIVPEWLPKTQIWFNLDRWGVSGAAPIIERRAQERGALSREESVQDRTARFRRDAEFQAKRTQFLKSADGVHAANASARAVSEEIAQLLADPQFAQLGIHLKRDQLYTVVLGGIRAFNIGWRNPYSNTLEGSNLYVGTWRGHPPLRGTIPFDEPVELKRRVFNFDVGADQQGCWREDGGQERAFHAEELAAHIVKGFLDELQHARAHEGAT